MISSGTVNGHSYYFLNKFAKLLRLCLTGEATLCSASYFYTYFTFLFFLGKESLRKLMLAGRDCYLSHFLQE